MATIDPNIAMGYKPVQIENPLNQLAAMTQIQSGQQGQQMNMLKMQEYQRGLEEENKLRTLLSGGGDINSPDVVRQMYGISPTKGLEFQQKQALIKKAGLETTGLELKNFTDSMSQYRNALDMVRTPEQLLAWQEAIHKDPITGSKLASMGMPYDSVKQQLMIELQKPGGFQAALTQSKLGATKFAELNKPQYMEQNLGGTNRITALPGLGIGAPTTVSETRKEATPGELLVDARARERLNAELQSTGTLTPAAIDVAAQIYIQTGALPALGIGKNAGMLKSAVLNRATELYNNPAGAAPNVNPAGVTPNVNAPTGANAPAPFNAANMAEQIIGNKMDVAAKSKAVRDFASGPESRKITAFNTAINHLDTLSKLSVALQNNDVQAINYIGNAFAKATGQPAPTTFDAAKSIIGSEIAKAVSGAGATALGDRKEIREAIESKNSPAQLAEVINGFTELLGGQLDSMQHTYKSSTGRTDFNTKLTPRAREVVSKLSTNATANPTTVTTSDGKTYNFPTPEDAAKFKQAAGIK